MEPDMTDIYLHGIETIERNDGPRPVEAIDTGVIGMVITAPDADATVWRVTPIDSRGALRRAQDMHILQNHAPCTMHIHSTVAECV